MGPLTRGVSVDDHDDRYDHASFEQTDERERYRRVLMSTYLEF